VDIKIKVKKRTKQVIVKRFEVTDKVKRLTTKIRKGKIKCTTNVTRMKYNRQESFTEEYTTTETHWTMARYTNPQKLIHLAERNIKGVGGIAVRR